MEALHALIGRDTETILWWQMCVRAVLILLFGLALIRIFGRRAFGKQAALDIVFAIIVGSNLSRALTATSPFVPTLAATATLALAYWLLEAAAARWGACEWLFKGKPIWLMRQATLDHSAMRRAAISPRDLAEAARTSGHHDLDDVEEAALERNGDISTLGRRR